MIKKSFRVSMKIRIIGCSGSGKTYLALKLVEKLRLSHFDLDNIFWDNSEAYGTKREDDERDKLLSSALDEPSWVIEGVYYKWCLNTFDQADIIILLEPKLKLCKSRIKKRFIKRKLGLEKGKKETLKSLKELLKWTDKFYSDNLLKIKEILNGYKTKVVMLKTEKEIDDFLEKI